MNEGSPKVICRISPELKARVIEAIQNRNRRTREEPWDFSTFIRIAIRDKLHHMERSRRPRPARRSGSAKPAEAGE